MRQTATAIRFKNRPEGLRLRAVPEDGKAKPILITFLARTLRVACSNIEIANGGRARLKTVHVADDPATLDAQLEYLGGGA